MPVEFFEEDKNKNISFLPKKEGGSLTHMIMKAGMARSVSGTQTALVVIAILAVFMSIVLFSVRRDIGGGSAPSSADIQAMSDLLKKR